LIATDDETFTLLLLCWNPSKESPIHDHPWVRLYNILVDMMVDISFSIPYSS
jgi:hypothetical protein